jgi:hypothetical protein
MAGSYTRMAPRIRKLNARIDSSGQTSPERGCAGMAPQGARVYAPPRYAIPMASAQLKRQGTGMQHGSPAEARHATRESDRLAATAARRPCSDRWRPVPELRREVFPRSVKRGIPERILVARMPETRVNRISETARLANGNCAPIGAGPSVPSNPSLNRTSRARLSSLAGVTGGGPVGMKRWAARPSSANRDCSNHA